MRTRLHPLLLGAATLLGACTSTTEVRPDQDALDAAAQFATLGSQAAGSGADPDVVSAYYGIAGALGRTGRISPVTVVIDGTPLDFLATAQQVETDAGPGCSTTASLCPLRPPLRSVVAWQKSDPRRVVQFTAIGGSASIGESISVSSSGGIAQVGSLLYFDGSGGVYRSTSGTVRIPDPVTSDTPCRTLPEGVVSASSAPEFGPCTRAEFTASVDGSVAPPPFTVRGNTATGTHTIVMAS